MQTSYPVWRRARWTTPQGYRWRVLWLVALVLCVGVSSYLVVFPHRATAAGAVPGDAQLAPGSVDQNSGAFTASIPIDVPKFHGLEPKLALTYSSLAGSGPYGFGWQLAGESRIARVSAGRGAPTYTSADRFLFDGEELVASTALGGTHVTKRQSYQRIKYDSVADTWSVTDTHGTVTSYTQRLVPAFQTLAYEYRPTSAIDLHGNRINYTYYVDPGRYTYLSTISYTGALITLYRELDSQPTSEAAGGWRTLTQYRVKTIDVTAAGSRARAYKLTYASSGTTGRSLLESVQRFGRDAVLDASGTVTGGTAARAIDPSYTQDANTLGTKSAWLPSWCNASGSTGFGSGGDFDGDGRSDIWCRRSGSPYNISVALSTGTAFQSMGVWSSNWCTSTAAQLRFGDFNGDGRSDVWCHNESTGANFVGFSDGATTFTKPVNGPSLIGGASTWCTGVTNVAYGAADFNGDGKADLWCQASSTGNVRVAVSDGSGNFADGSVWISGACSTVHIGVGDVTGDGKADFWCAFLNTTSLVHYTSTGTGLSLAGSGAGCPSGEVGSGDFNGDGKADIYCHTSANDNYIGLSEGGTTRATLWLANWCGADLVVGDFNGDGRDDLSCHSASLSRVTVALSNGWNTFEAPVIWSDTFCNVTYYFVVDLDGDGKTDVLCHDNVAGGANVALSSNPGYRADQLEVLYNELGGFTRVGYAPATSWPHSLRPPGRPLMTVAQTSTVATTSAAISTYSYSGGVWDPLERRFLGYATVDATDQTSHASTRTQFRVSAGYPANRITSISQRDAALKTLARNEMTYSESLAGGVYTSLVSSQTQSLCDTTGVCQSSRTDLSYDGYGNVTQRADVGGTGVAGDEKTTTTAYTYNAATYLVNTPSLVTVRRGIGATGAILTQTSYGYNAAGDRTSSGRWLDTTNTTVTSSAGYDSYGNQTTSTDELNHSTTTAYDTTYHLFPTNVCNALAQCTSTTWDTVLGVASSVTDVNLKTTSHQYDALGRETLETRPDGATTATSYVNWGSVLTQYVLTTISDGTADGQWKKTYVDGQGRTTQTVAEPDVTVVTQYDSRGMVSTVSNPYRTGQTPVYTSYQYDALGKLVKTTLPDGRTRTTSYGLAVNAADPDFATARYAATSCDERNVCRRVAYDGRLNPAVVSEWDGAAEYRTHAGFDELGQLVRVTDAVGNVTTQVWDTLGRKKSVTDPDNGTWSYGYDNAGHAISQTDGRGQVITSRYDALGRLVSQLAGATVLLTNTYDQVGHGAGIGRITSSTDGSGSASWTYDAMGRTTQVVKTIDATAYTLKETYDAAGRRASVTYPDNEVVSYTYDAMGCLNRVGSYVTAATCTAAMSTATMTLGNAVTITNTYDVNRLWLTGDTVKNGAGVILQSESYGYDPSGRVTSKTSADAKDQWSYVYDPLGRLTGATNTTTPAYSASYSYDKVGRLLSGTGMGTMTYPAAGAAHPHAPTTANGKAFTYNSAGQRTSDGTSSFGYDAYGRLASVTTGATTVNYAYDGMGKRTKAGATTFLHLDGQLVFQANGAATSKFYYYGASRVARKDNTGAVYYYIGNHLGSPHLILDSTAAVVQTTVYGPYGTVATSSGTLSDPFGMAGEYRDSASLYQMGARYLSVQVGQFLTPDTSGSIDVTAPQSLNRYAYGLNDPINHIDPSGQVAISPRISPQTVAGLVTFSITDTTPKQFQINLNLNPIILSYTFPNGDLLGKFTTTFSVPIRNVYSLEMVGGTVNRGFAPVGIISGLNVGLSVPVVFSGKLKAETMMGPGNLHPDGGFYFKVKAEANFGLDPHVHMKTLLDIPKGFAVKSAPEAGSPFEAPQGSGHGTSDFGDLFDYTNTVTGGIPAYTSFMESLFSDVATSTSDLGLDGLSLFDSDYSYYDSSSDFDFNYYSYDFYDYYDYYYDDYWFDSGQ